MDIIEFEKAIEEEILPAFQRLGFDIHNRDIYKPYVDFSKEFKSIHLNLPALRVSYYYSREPIHTGSWFCYGTDYGLDASYPTRLDLLNALKELIKKLTPDIWLEASWLGNYINKNGRVKVVFSNGQQYSLNASNIVALVISDNKLYIGYKTNNVQYYSKNFPTANKVSGKLVHPIIVVEERCARCKRLWEYDADERYEYCPYCGCSKTITTKKLIWNKKHAQDYEYEWYPDAPAHKPDY